MKRKKIKKWLLSSILVLVILSIGTIIFINYQLKSMYGGHTEIVDYTQFKYIYKTTAVTNVNILSPDASTFIENQTVLIEQGKIKSIGEIIKLPKQIEVIDAQGKFLIPGLIDSHVHLFQSPNDLLLYLANGVTTIREMTGNIKHLKLRQEIDKGNRIGPNMFVASSKLNTHKTFEGWFVTWTQPVINVNKIDEIETTIKSLSDDGYDAIKLGSLLSKESYQALNTATDNVGIPEIGHLPMSITLNELWNSNQEEIAHVEEIVKMLIREFGKISIENKNAFLQFVKERSYKISDNLLKKDMVITSTIRLSENLVRHKFEIETLFKEVEISYANPGIVEGTILTSRALGWLPEINQYRLSSNYSIEKLEDIKNYWTTYAEAHHILIKIMSEKGVKILAGTDANVSALVAGFSLHDEFKSMNKAGMLPSEVLNSATVLPAKWMKKNTGRIEVGYDADLVLLKENPLENIENTKTIETVISKGKVFNRDELDAILEAVKNANKRCRNKDISSFID